jgi:hypothetical protein
MYDYYKVVACDLMVRKFDILISHSVTQAATKFCSTLTEVTLMYRRIICLYYKICRQNTTYLQSEILIFSIFKISQIPYAESL